MPLRKIHTIILIVVSAYTATSQSWYKLNTTGTLSSRSNASSIYIPQKNKLFVFGGITTNGNVNDLWSLDLNTNQWSNIPYNSTVNPIPRSTHTCMYDSITNCLLLWSGDGGILLNDVWSFHFSDSTWQQLFADGNVNGAPLKRYGNASCFDPVNRKIINFAGFTTSGRFDDTWTFNVDNHTWNDVSTSYFPLRRCLSGASISLDRREMIVFGGQSTGNLNDIWLLNLDTYNWRDVTPNTNPPARHFTSTTYYKNGNVTIFGGNNLNQGNQNGVMNDFWKFSIDNQRWDTLPQNGYKPEPRFGHCANYILSQDKLIIFGGQGILDKYNDTWIYSNISNVTTTVSDLDKNVVKLRCSPNPSSGNFIVSFYLPNEQLINISLYDLTGNETKVLSNEKLSEGNHTFTISAQLESGIYFGNLRSSTVNQFTKIIISK